MFRDHLMSLSVVHFAIPSRKAVVVSVSTVSIWNYRSIVDWVKINDAIPKYSVISSLRIRGFAKRYGCIEAHKRVSCHKIYFHKD